MMNKLLDYAILAVTMVIWGFAMNWATAGGYWDSNFTIIVTVVAFMIVNGTTTGGNAFEHIVSGFKGCLTGVVGFIVAHIVYDVVNMATGAAFDMNTTMMGIVGVILAYLTAMMMSASMNSIRS